MSPRRQRPYSVPRESLFSLMEGMRADYEAARESRFVRRREGVIPMGSSADYHIRDEYHFHMLREQARDMERNDMIVGQIIERAVANEVQEGFRLKPSTGDDSLDRDLKARFGDWSDDPDQSDLAGEHCFNEMQGMLNYQAKVDGDIFVLPTEEGSLQVVEAHRCRRPQRTRRNVVHGVLLEPDTRRRLEYWFAKDDVDPMYPVNLVSEIERYPARDANGHRQVFHLYRSTRFSMTRGITSLAPIFAACGMFEDTNFAQMVRQQVVSCFVIFRKRGPNWRGGGGDTQYGERSSVTLEDGSSRSIEGLGPGMEVRGDPDEDLQGFSPDVPSPQFFEHVRLILTLISTNLGLPLVIALMDASETNFSGFRGALDQAKLGFRKNQRSFIRRFLRPVYLWKVRRWLDPASGEYDRGIAAAAKKSGISIFRHVWQPPGWPYIEPLKDATADLIITRNGLNSRSRVFAARDPRRRGAGRGDHRRQ